MRPRACTHHFRPDERECGAPRSAPHASGVSQAKLWPLHPFCPAHEFCADLQEPWPLHEFTPSHLICPAWESSAARAACDPATKRPATADARTALFQLIRDAMLKTSWWIRSPREWGTALRCHGRAEGSRAFRHEI